jgi:hypothetical protein
MMNKTSPGVGFPAIENKRSSIGYDDETAKITKGMDTTHGSQFRTVNDHSAFTPLALNALKAPFNNTKSTLAP